MSQLSSLPLPTNYTKVYEDENTLVAKLIARGLVVDDENELRQILRVVGYYRLTGYLYPFLKAGSEDYEGGTTLASVWRLYSFDRRLRLVAADALARIEVAVRAKTMEYHTAYCNGDPFAYCKQTDMPGLSGQSFVRFVDAVDKAVRQAARANNPAVVHHVALHGQTKVPVWMLMENLSFGDVMVYYRGLPNAVQQKVANDFGIWPSAFRGWLNLLRNARNICAHQGRLWNRKINSPISYSFGNNADLADLYACLSVQSGVLHTTLFTVLSLCAWMLRSIRPQSRWTSRVKDLFADYPEVPLSAMGFPVDWQKFALWK